MQNNRRWAAKIEAERPGFFAKLAQQQNPDYLWIGCADSRVPANEIVDLDPGELFVHRNVANVITHTDLNCLSVVQFAVDVLKVEHIIVTGHYGCGGVRYAMDGVKVGLADNWLRHVRDVYMTHQDELLAIENPDRRADRLCELNVAAQVRNLSLTTMVQDAWERGQPVMLHGWCYGLKDGLVRDLGISMAS
jgi:carbonic anhydrase